MKVTRKSSMLTRAARRSLRQVIFLPASSLHLIASAKPNLGVLLSRDFVIVFPHLAFLTMLPLPLRVEPGLPLNYQLRWLHHLAFFFLFFYTFTQNVVLRKDQFAGGNLLRYLQLHHPVLACLLFGCLQKRCKRFNISSHHRRVITFYFD